MSEVIVRMEMPKECAECGLVDESDRCVLLGTFAGDKSVRIPKCPIIGELPEQHGRLIDESKIMIPYDICDGHEAMDFVNETPTIVPATERSET